MSDEILHESNRAAHRVAKEAALLCGYFDCLETEVLHMLPLNMILNHDRLHRAVSAYEEIERKAQREATA